MTRNGFTIVALGLFGEKFDEGRTIGDFSHGFCKGFAHFRREDHRQIRLMFHHQIIPVAQDIAAFLRGQRGPFLLCCLSAVNRPRQIGTRKVSDLCDHITARGV